MDTASNDQFIRPASPPPLLTLKDVAKELGMSLAAIRRVGDSLGNDATPFFSM